MTEHRIELVDLDKLAADRAGHGHSIFAPSYSSTWLYCAGALVPSLFARDDAGEDAAYGTVAHYVTETWLRSGRRPDHLIGENVFVESGDWGYLIDIDEVMLEHAATCVDSVSMLPGDKYVELKVDFSKVTPIKNQRGTMDFAAATPGRLVVKDWKFGKQVEVMAERNTQLMLYTLGFFYEYDWLYDFQEFEMHIVQPRRNHMDSWTITRAELLEFEAFARERAHAAWKVDAPRTPGEKQCRWCKVRFECAALAKVVHDITAEAFAPVDVEVTTEDVQQFKDELTFMVEMKTAPIANLTTAEMATLLRYRATAEAWWKALADELLRRSSQGEKIPGYKLVESRTHRAFRDSAKVERALRKLGVPDDVIWKRELISPTQAEKELRKLGFKSRELPELLEPLVFKPPGKPTLAPLTDKRPEISEITSEAFADLTTETDEMED